MLTRLQHFNEQRTASLGVLQPARTDQRPPSLAGDSMLVSSKHSAMLCPSMSHRSTRVKSRILSKGQFIVLTTSSTQTRLEPATSILTSWKESGQQEETRFLSSTELGMTSPDQVVGISWILGWADLKATRPVTSTKLVRTLPSRSTLSKLGSTFVQTCGNMGVGHPRPFSTSKTKSYLQPHPRSSHCRRSNHGGVHPEKALHQCMQKHHSSRSVHPRAS